MTVPTNQQQFLSNTHNKSPFIFMLCERFTAANIIVKQAGNDADVLIIETAIEQSNATNNSIVVGEDVDLLVLLTARTPIDKIIYFLKPWKAHQPTEIYSSKSLSAYPKCQNYTTSAFFQEGKTTAFKLFEKRDLTNCAEVFQKIDSSPQDIVTNRICFLLGLYGASNKIDCLD